MFDAVPMKGHDWVTGKGRCHSRHQVREDSRTCCLTVEDHSIQLGGEGVQLRLDVVDGSKLGGDILDGGVDDGLPDHEVIGRLLDELEPVAEGAFEAVDARCHC